MVNRSPHPTRALPAYWLSRFIVACWAGSNALVGMSRPDSLTAQALQDSGPMGAVALALLGIMCSIAIIDCFVNDLLPDRFTLCTISHRHLGFMAIAIVLVLIAGVIAKHDGVSMLLLAYLMPAALAVLVTFLDLFARRRKTPA